MTPLCEYLVVISLLDGGSLSQIVECAATRQRCDQMVDDVLKRNPAASAIFPCVPIGALVDDGRGDAG